MTLKWVFCGVGVLCGLLATDASALDTLDAGPKNGLSSQAFLNNALTTNKIALEELANKPLSWLFSRDNAYIMQQLRDPNARAMAREIVSCALDASPHQLDFPDDGGPSLKGELGLCYGPNAGDAGDWYAAPPTEKCLRLVTACVMARVNALHESIPMSLHSPSAAWARPEDPVVTNDRYRESFPGSDPAEGIPIPSFRSTCGPEGDCGWVPAYVGTCPSTAGRVRLTLESPVPSGAELRICDGIFGCTSTPKVLLGNLSPAYSKRIDDFPLTSGPAGTVHIDFECQKHSAYYSVMSRGTMSGSPGGGALKLHASTPDIYPANTKQVFGFIEGAFWGNMFDSKQLRKSCEVNLRTQKRDPVMEANITCQDQEGRVTEYCTLFADVRICNKLATSAPLAPYGNVHVCYSFEQEMDSQLGDLGVAYLNARICDLPNASEQCFSEPPVPCQGPSADSAHCGWDAKTGSFVDCQGLSPITTYLNDPCDLIGQGKLCDQVKRLMPKTLPKPVQTGCRSGCGRSDAAGDAVVAILLVAVVVIVIRRRRRRA